MIDYRVWVQELERFVNGLAPMSGNFEHDVSIAPPLSRGERERLDKSLRLPLPRPIAAFLEQGSGACFSNYFWEPVGDTVERLMAILQRQYIFGGLPLCDAKNLRKWQESCLDYATKSWLVEEPAEQAIWLRGFPFAFMSTGDFLALDVIAGENPPVVYLCHDNDSRVLNRTFDEFLTEWQRVCYLGPELIYLECKEFLVDPSTGFLSGELASARTLREFLGMNEHPRTN